MLKRAFDVVTAASVTLCCLPLFAAIAALVRISSPGPILFRQERVGRDFRIFSLLKFRTMTDGASGPLVTSDGDERITAVGRVLRATKLDELPQLINILRGDMSVVGPRPEVSRYVEQYRDDYEDILRVRPGLTELATIRFIDEGSQLAGHPDPEEAYVREVLPEKIQLSRRYLERASLTYDLGLILRTLAGMANRMLDTAPRPTTGSDDETEARPGTLRFIRRAVVIAIHLGAVACANYLAFWLRFDGSIPSAQWSLFLQTLPWLIGIRALTFVPYRLYEGLWRYTSLWDLRKIVSAGAVSSGAWALWVYGALQITAYSRAVIIIDTLLLVVALGGLRMVRRMVRSEHPRAESRSLLIVGAGDGGEALARSLSDDRNTPYRLLGFLDDDPQKWGRRIHGVRVLGPISDIRRHVETTAPDEIVVAEATTTPDLARQLLRDLEDTAIAIKTFPGYSALLESDTGTLPKLRALSVDDLLERAPIGLDRSAVEEMVAGRRVLVTGAGGSIGSELCRQIAALDPKVLVLYERYENNLHAVSSELRDNGLSAVIRPVIGDIRDTGRLRRTMETYRPDIVLHAAAHKHVPLMEENPHEAVLNNVLGTRGVADAAEAVGVERFVLISTDKAVNPSSVMGATKRLAELVVQHRARQSDTAFFTVRFGNVLGSNGSVLERFQQQVESGGPVTVTHPEMQRFFMLIPEAVDLVLHAAALGEHGAGYVLEMGDQIKLVDLARNVIRLSGRVPDQDVEITFVGLRPGEKLYEELSLDEEKARPSAVDHILKIEPFASVDLDMLEDRLVAIERDGLPVDAGEVVDLLEDLLPEFAKRPVPAKP